MQSQSEVEPTGADDRGIQHPPSPGACSATA